MNELLNKRGGQDIQSLKNSNALGLDSIVSKLIKKKGSSHSTTIRGKYPKKLDRRIDTYQKCGEPLCSVYY